jgi:hypothetical protein
MKIKIAQDSSLQERSLNILGFAADRATYVLRFEA